jgi:hypothetical protein
LCGLSTAVAAFQSPGVPPGGQAPQRRQVHPVALRVAGPLEAGGQFRKGLRVKGVKGATGVLEMTWADNGRATFQYGAPVVEGEPHVIWRRVGTHGISSPP